MDCRFDRASVELNFLIILYRYDKVNGEPNLKYRSTYMYIYQPLSLRLN